MESKKVLVGTVVILVTLAVLPIVASKLVKGANEGAKTPEAPTGTPAPVGAASGGGAQVVGEEVATALLQGNFAAVTARFDERMKAALPEAQLAATLQGLKAQAGALKRQLGTRCEKVQGMDVVIVSCEFERAKLDVQVTVDGSGRVAGLFIRPGGN